MSSYEHNDDFDFPNLDKFVLSTNSEELVLTLDPTELGYYHDLEAPLYTTSCHNLAVAAPTRSPNVESHANLAAHHLQPDNFSYYPTSSGNYSDSENNNSVSHAPHYAEDNSIESFFPISDHSATFEGISIGDFQPLDEPIQDYQPQGNIESESEFPDTNSQSNYFGRLPQHFYPNHSIPTSHSLLNDGRSKRDFHYLEPSSSHLTHGHKRSCSGSTDVQLNLLEMNSNASTISTMPPAHGHKPRSSRSKSSGSKRETISMGDQMRTLNMRTLADTKTRLRKAPTGEGHKNFKALRSSTGACYECKFRKQVVGTYDMFLQS